MGTLAVRYLHHRGIAVGLVLTRTQLIVFHDIIPLVILGYLVKDKQKWFD